MSGRLLRKVLKEQEQQQQQRSTNQEPELEEESDSPQSCAPARNPFDLLDDHPDDEVAITDGISDGDVAEQIPVVQTSFEPTLSTNKKSKKKKKKNKVDPTSAKIRPEKPLDLLLEDLAIVDANNGVQGDLSDFRAGLEKSKAANAKVQANPTKQHVSSVLLVDPKFLRAENELRRIFGSKVVNSFENYHSSGSSRQTHGGRRGTYNPKKTILVAPSGNWPRWDGSLSMEVLESKNGEHFFRYAPSSPYSHAQIAFESARAIHDLNGIASILAHHPYHIESLLTIAEVLKFSGEHQLSADAIGKCLFALECAWHPMFNPLQGNCRLEYCHDMNKPLFTALFSHMQNMDRRGCHRSALEVCKLLLSLDSEDPMGALLCIDYFSLRAEEYAWLERFSDEYRSDNSLWLFPNFSYSLPICRFYLEQHDLASENASGQTEKASSCDLMKQALMLHPLVVKKLVARAPLKDPAWTKILKHPFFGSAQAGSPSLDHLISIYVERNYIMWRFPDLQKLLKEAALQVIESVNRSDRDIRDWACVRKEAFSSEKNENREVVGDIRVKKLELFKAIGKLDKLKGSIDWNPEFKEAREAIKIELSKIMKMEEISWKQKSRDKFIKEGDRNTSFFHLLANYDRRKKMIEKIKVGNEVLAVGEGLEEAVVDHFENSFKATKWSKFLFPDFLKFDRISLEDQARLKAEFFENEVCATIASMEGDAAPGPNGFTIRFFKDASHIVGRMVMEAFQEFHTRRHLDYRLNNVLISLIPKTPSPSNISNFRPIAVINTIYCILAKLLVNGLVSVLPNIISQEGGAFVKGRLLLNGVSVSSEVVDSIYKANGMVDSIYKANGVVDLQACHVKGL